MASVTLVCTAIFLRLFKRTNWDDAKETEVPVRGFLQTAPSRMSKWEAWLPSPCEWRPMRGGLGGNKEFEGAEIEARSAGSQWVSLLVEGTLGRNNDLRLATQSRRVPRKVLSFAS